VSFLGIQSDLGGFDPRFLGITVRFNTPDEFDRFNARNYAFTVAQLEAMSDDQAFCYLAEMTVLAHEARHFHDFLLSSYGQTFFRWKLQAYFNGSQALGLLAHGAKSSGANCLPIPITRWARMDQADRTAQIQQWNRGPKKPPGGGNWRPPPVPQQPSQFINLPKSGAAIPLDGPDALPLLLATTIRAYDKASELLNNPDSAKAPTPLQPWHIMEVSALLVQTQEIINIGGDALAGRFLASLETSGFPKSAVRLFQALQSLWHDRRSAPELSDLASIVTWSLMGSYKRDGWRACPTHRIANLFKLLQISGPPPKHQPLKLTFRKWAEATGLSDPIGALKDQVDSNKELIRSYSAAVKRGSRVTTSFRGAQVLHQATSIMLQAFDRDPEQYVSPKRYLTGLNLYPRPAVRCEFDGIRIQVPRMGVRFRKNWLVIFANSDLSRRQFMRTGLLKRDFPGIEVVTLSAAANLYLDILAVDYAFQPTNRLDWEFGEIARPSFAKEFQLTPLQITG
jgi:hypothetical protein